MIRRKRETEDNTVNSFVVSCNLYCILYLSTIMYGKISTSRAPTSKACGLCARAVRGLRQ
jgi:hypothetical protein